MTPSTPTGIPITACTTCGLDHPFISRHCRVCGVLGVFASRDGRCLKHPKPSVAAVSS